MRLPNCTSHFTSHGSMGRLLTSPEPVSVISGPTARAGVREGHCGPAYDGSSDKVVVDELGRPPRPEWYSNTFKRLRDNAGVPAMRLHDARHTSVTIMRSIGVPDHVVAAWHGHDEAVMARTYTHAYMDELREAARKVAGEM